MTSAMRRRLGDRRARTRFEIVGQLWGALETIETLTLRDLGPGGALLETEVDLPLDSVQRVRFTLGDQVTELQGRVRHVTPAQATGSPGRYLVGLEFLAVPPAAHRQIAHIMSANAAPPGSGHEG